MSSNKHGRWPDPAYVRELENQVRHLKEQLARLEDLQSALQKSESRLREAQRLAHLGFWEVDLLTGELYWSDETFRIFEVEPDTFEASYQAFLDLVHPDDRRLVDETYKKSVEKKTHYEIEHRLLLRNGKIKYVTEKGHTEYDGSGNPVRSMGIVWDITERHELEEQLRQSQKMEAVGRLTGGIAHDFNNLLTTILGYSEIALLSLPDDDPMHVNVKAVFEAAEKASILVKQLLAFSRKEVIDTRIVNLRTIVSNISSLLERLMGEDIIIDFNIDTETNNIQADVGQMEQILLNLCVNARDAMPGGGRLIIDIEQIELECDYYSGGRKLSSGKYVILSVTDNGSGIPPENIDKIFEPFFTTKQQGHGTGLGLSTVYGIVRRQKGQIFVYSQPGVGTTFKVYLPVAKEDMPEDQIQAPVTDTLPRGTETILVVDDEPGIRNLVQDTLAPLGYKVLSASGGKEAFEIVLKSDKLDLILTDVIMPGMNGMELVNALSGSAMGIKVLFMSGYTDNVIARHGILEKGINFISKPLVPSLLAVKIRQILDRH